MTNHAMTFTIDDYQYEVLNLIATEDGMSVDDLLCIVFARGFWSLVKETSDEWQCEEKKLAKLRAIDERQDDRIRAEERQLAITEGLTSYFSDLDLCMKTV